jgi:hypothetical protein
MRSSWFIAAMLLISTPAIAEDYVEIPFIVNESMRAYCEEQAGDYGACMKDQHTAYVQSELQSRRAHKAIEAECAGKYRVNSREWAKCNTFSLTCTAEGCLRRR